MEKTKHFNILKLNISFFSVYKCINSFLHARKTLISSMAIINKHKIIIVFLL